MLPNDPGVKKHQKIYRDNQDYPLKENAERYREKLSANLPLGRREWELNPRPMGYDSIVLTTELFRQRIHREGIIRSLCACSSRLAQTRKGRTGREKRSGPSGDLSLALFSPLNDPEVKPPFSFGVALHHKG